MKSFFKSAAGLGIIGTLGYYSFKIENKHAKMAFTGILAQLTTDILFHPIDILNTYTKYNFSQKISSYDAVSRVYNYGGGLKGFLVGFDVLIYSSGIYGLTYYTLYKYIKDRILDKHKGGEGVNIVAYSIASVFSELVLMLYYPIDMIKTRIISFSVKYHNLPTALNHIVDRNNIPKSILHLYNGFSSTTVLKTVEVFFMFVSFEICRDFFARRKGIKSDDVVGLDYFLSSMFSGVITALFTNILEVYAIQKQVHMETTIRSFLKTDFIYAIRSGIGIRSIHIIFYTVVLLENINIFGKLYGIHF